MKDKMLKPVSYTIEREFLSRISVPELFSRIIRNRLKGLQEESRQAGNRKFHGEE